MDGDLSIVPATRQSKNRIQDRTYLLGDNLPSIPHDVAFCFPEFNLMQFDVEVRVRRRKNRGNGVENEDADVFSSGSFRLEV